MSGARGRAWRLALLLCGVVVAIDQGTKALIEHNLTSGETVDFLGPIKLTNVENSGIAFGLADGGGVLILLFSIAALLLIGFVFATSADRPGVWVAMGSLVGGALGNLADRIRADAVTDFIDFPAWPAFNVADIAITIGVALLAVSLLREPRASAEPQKS